MKALLWSLGKRDKTKRGGLDMKTPEENAEQLPRDDSK